MKTTLCFAGLWILSFGITASAARIDLSDHGGLPDDSGDDLPALNRAIAAAGPGDTVFIGTGSYLISDSISLKSDIRLVGSGRDTTIIKYVGARGRPMLQVSKASNVEVANLTLDGGGNPNAHQGITASSCARLYLHHLGVRNFVKGTGFGPHGVYFSSAVTDSMITESTFENIGTDSQWGAAMRISTGSPRNRILGNTISATGRGGILCDRDSTDLVIRENRVSKSGGEGLGIEIWHGCHRSIIEDNIIDHWLSVDGSDNVAVRRNTISDKSGIYKWTALELVNSRDCVFSGNTADDGAHIGISVSNKAPKEYIYWAHNTIRHASTWGAQIQGEAGGASYHYFYGNKFIETYKDHPKAPYRNQGYGVRFNGNCHHITLDDNEIRDNGGGGIQFTGERLDQLSFINNSIVSNGGLSVNSDPAAKLEWENNEVDGNGRDVALSSRGFSNRKPTALFESPSQLRAGHRATFVNRSSDPDGTIGHVLWDFDDGIPSSSVNGEHTYDKPGYYRAAMIVWDNAGRAARAERRIKVAANP
jgi:hypothetical protein